STAAQFAGNAARRGGAVYAASGSQLRLSGVTATQNNATTATAGDGGGAVQLQAVGSATIDGGSSFAGNAATAADGGAVVVRGGVGWPARRGRRAAGARRRWGDARGRRRRWGGRAATSRRAARAAAAAACGRTRCQWYRLTERPVRDERGGGSGRPGAAAACG